MAPKPTIVATRGESAADLNAPLWFMISCFLLLTVAILLLIVALGDRIYTSNLSAMAIAIVLVSLGCTVVLQVRAWHLGRQRIHATECEFTSIYQNALDGILILNDQAVCLDANPAAFALLGSPPAALIGHSFAEFYADRFEFDLQWRRFLEGPYRQGPTRLFRLDGSKLFVHLKAAANYLPGRHVLILSDSTGRVLAQDSLRESKERLQQMADNIEEIFWLLDVATKEVLQVNRAYETITGRSIESLSQNPTSYVDMIYADDRVHVLTKLEDALRSGQLDEEFRIVRSDGAIRWVSVHAFPVSDRNRRGFRRLAGTAQDITARKLAEGQIAKHLATAEVACTQADAARAEAEALRKATLALTQNLRMDVVLDTLLACVFEIIPYERASVILTETDGQLFVARVSPAASRSRTVITLEANENVFLQRVIVEKKSLHLSDTREETDWRETKALAKTRSWIAVPLVVGDSVLGVLSIGATHPRSFTTEHFRLAKSLAIPAAVAIHNARLYEWAEIYAAEREDLLKKANAIRSTDPAERNRFLQ
jgi:PAS domain S-box-containing protein